MIDRHKDRVLGDFEQHESFGMIGLSRCQIGGSGARMFGCAVKCNHAMSITIRRCASGYNLHNDHYYGREELIDVMLSPSQFADMLTSPNVGFGVPCTIQHVGGKRMEDVPDEIKSEPEKIQDEFKDTAKNLSAKLNDSANGIRARYKYMKKADREAVEDALGGFMQEVRSNLPFMMQMLQESAEKVVTQAKHEVIAFTDAAVRRAGLEHLKKQAPVLEIDGGGEK